MPSRLELINALRVLAMDAVEKAQSGHPGAPMGMADMGEALWRGFMKHNPRNPAWADRDRFVLSNGHASMLLYGLLHLCGYDLGMEEIGRFRQLGSKTPGHPESRVTPGVEVTTGPLGQGVGMAVGLALAESLLARRFNREGFPVVDHRTWVFLGDGCLMEGVAQEACSLAGTLGLGKLTALYDDNGITIDGPVKGWFSDDTPARFEAMGWHVVRNVGGNDAADVDDALHEALAVTGKPSLICCKTVIGYGSPLKAGDASCHGAPLGADEASAARRRLGWNHEPFVIPEEYYAAWDCKAKGEAAEAEWNALFAAYAEAYPDLAAEFRRRMDGSLPGDWAARCADMMRSARAGKSSATRVAGKHMLDALAPLLPELVGGSADLSASNGTRHASAVTIGPEAMDGNYLEYGVREFGMGAIMNGLAAHGGFIPYGGTFLVFADYAKSAIRLAALMGKRVIWVLSHDSIGVGEDGPTHQPVEQLAALRLTPGVDLWRPCDNLESAVAWTAALERADGPTCLAMSRQNVPSQEHEAGQEDLIRRGGYVLRPARGEALALILASGSEVSLALQAAEELEAQGIGVQVVSMPCCEVFDRQDAAYRDSVLPPALTRRLAVEAAAAGWWWKYVGLNGAILGMEGFGSSAPAGVLFEHFSFTVSCVVAKVKALLT